MSSGSTIGDLIEARGGKLGLDWIAGKDGVNRSLRTKSSGGSDALLAGHLNFIHPPLIQIVSDKELLYLNNLNQRAYSEALDKLFSDTTVAILFAGGIAVPDDFIDCAEESALPLMRSSLSGRRLSELCSYYVNQMLTERVTRHGVFLEVLGLGVLLTGESGIGKSELALELVARGHTLIADDAPEFIRTGPDNIVGSCPETLMGFIEVRGLGILDLRAMYGENACRKQKNLDLIIHLQLLNELDTATINRLEGITARETLLDLPITQVTVPVAAGRNLAVIVEAAIRNQMLISGGYNAAQTFIEKQHESLEVNR